MSLSLIETFQNLPQKDVTSLEENRKDANDTTALLGVIAHHRGTRRCACANYFSRKVHLSIKISEHQPVIDNRFAGPAESQNRTNRVFR